MDELLLMRGEELQRSALRQNVVSSRFFSSSQALSYSLSEFLVHLEQQCVQLSETGHMLLDFGSAENHLIDAYLGGKPVLELEMRMMQYISSVDAEAGVSLDSDASLEMLRAKVRQEPLPKDLQQVLLKELGSPSAARACLELLETAVSFLQGLHTPNLFQFSILHCSSHTFAAHLNDTETGGNMVQHLEIGEKLLGEYVASVLLMDAQAVRQTLGLKSSGASVFTTQLRLKHIESVHSALRDYLTVDPFAQVRLKYKQPLDEQSAQMVTGTARQGTLDLSVLLQVMKTFIIASLSEDTINDKVSIKETLSYLEYQDTYLSDFPWFAAFPDAVPMANIVEVYNALRAAAQLN